MPPLRPLLPLLRAAHMSGAGTCPKGHALHWSSGGRRWCQPCATYIDGPRGAIRSPKDVANLLIASLTTEAFELGHGLIPKSYPYVALMTEGISVETYDAALNLLEGLGFILHNHDEIRPGPRFAELAAMAARLLKQEAERRAAERHVPRGTFWAGRRQGPARG
jgi:hypothetical protein